MSRNNNNRSSNASNRGSAGTSGRRGPRREPKKQLDYEARATRNGVSANHLLNFSLPERERSVHTHKKKAHAEPPRTQSEYLHANYRFVISQLDKSASIPTWDLEALTEWKSVEQVLLWYDDASAVTCPICMDDLRAPKITKCGHIFCWPCILRYLSMTDKYWRRCPMCFESVQKGQLRSVRLEKVHLPPRVDSQVTFQFLQRSKSSMFPMLRPASGQAVTPRNAGIPSVYDRAAAFSRILESTPEYVTQLVLSEMRDLESLDAEYRSSGDVDSLPFVEEAMRVTSGRLAQLDHREAEISAGGHNDDASGKRKSSRCGAVGESAGDAYSFYQIADGSYVVLHSINMKCLMKEYSLEHQAAKEAERDGSYSPAPDSSADLTGWAPSDSGASTGSSTADTGGCVSYGAPAVDRHHFLPETVSGRVVDVEHAVMDDEAQKRYRFLSHLPRFCDFYVCEIDLTDQLSPETLESFRAELKKRTKYRKQKEKQRQAEAAKSAASPAFAHLHNLPAFSLAEEDSAVWPAPAELASALQDVSISGDDGAYFGSDDEMSTATADASWRSPPLSSSLSPSFEAMSHDDDGSFATITRNSGYYPPLGGPSSSQHSPQLGAAPSSDATRVMFGSPPSAWGHSATSSVSWATMASAQSGGKKKGAAKKGVPLFSTTQRRSYR